MNFDFDPTIRVIYGENKIDEVGSVTSELGGTSVLVVTDPGIRKTDFVERVIDSLRKRGIRSAVFDEVEENPTTDHVEAGVKRAAEEKINFLIGLGGGSAMDCAKGINFLLTNGGRMEDYWGFGKASKPMLPSIGIPTTAGTGSEAQSYALISQKGTHKKMACGDKKARFRVAILDPLLTLTTPQEVTAMAGLDAVTHAVESFVSTARNPLSQMFAKEAWRLLEQNLEVVLREPANVTARAQMLLGAHLAGCAIENSMLGAAHACANPLTARYNLHHGAAVGSMLPHVILFNASVVNGFYGELLRTAKLRKVYTESDAERLSDRIEELKRAAGIVAGLRDYGVRKDDLPELAREASEQWTAKFNPKPVSREDLLQIYNSAY